MATVAKTVYYAWPMLTASIAPATLTGSGANEFYTITASLGTKTMYFPETSSRVFKSVGLDIGWMDGLSIAQSIFGYKIDLAVNNSIVTASYDYLATTNADTSIIGNTGENAAMLLSPYDFTDYFNTNISPLSSSVDLNLTIYWRTTSSIGASNTSSAAFNYTSKLFATYEHEDTDTTYIKTAIIPLNSPTSSLSTSGNLILGRIDDIPILSGSGGFLPESDIVIRDYFVEIEGNETAITSTSFNITSSITSSTANFVTDFGLIQKTLNSDRFDRFIWSIPTSSLPNLAASHSFGMNNGQVSTTFRHICPTVYVTYEYNKTNTNRILNTVLLPQFINSPIGFTVESSASFVDRTFRILDSNLELKQSALKLNWNDNSNISQIRIKVGAQSAFKFYNDNGGAICGMKNVQHRIDSEAEFGPGINLIRGSNEISASLYTVGNIYATNVSGYYILNYHSDVPSIGIDNSTKYHVFSDRTFPRAPNAITTVYTSSILLTNSGSTYIIGQGSIFYTPTVGSQAYNLDTKIKTSEKNGLGYENIYSDMIVTDTELGSTYSTLGYGDYFARYLEAPSSTYLNPWNERQFRVLTIGVRFGLQRFVNISKYTYPLSGSIFNYDGDGSGYIVNIYDAVNDSLLYTLTTTPGGKFSTTWYDDTNLMYARVTDTSKYGISDRVTVTGSMNVYLTPFEYGYSSI